MDSPAETGPGAMSHASQGPLVPKTGSDWADLPLGRAFQYFRRLGHRAREAFLLAKAEAWSTDEGLELEYGSTPDGDTVARLSRKTWRESGRPEGYDGHWADADWEKTTEIVMMRPSGTDRAVAALLAMLLKETKAKT